MLIARLLHVVRRMVVAAVALTTNLLALDGASERVLVSWQLGEHACARRDPIVVLHASAAPQATSIPGCSVVMVALAIVSREAVAASTPIGVEVANVIGELRLMRL